MPTTMTDDAHAWDSQTQRTSRTDDAERPTRAPHVIAHPGRGVGTSSANPSDRSDRHTSSVLGVPITWLDLTPPSGSLHLKLMETRHGHRADIWSSRMSPDDQKAWAMSQQGWYILGECHARSFLVSFTVDSPPAGLAWLAQLSSYQRVDLHPDGKVHLHLSGPSQDLLAVHRRLRRATDVKVIRVADAAEAAMPVRDHG